MVGGKSIASDNPLIRACCWGSMLAVSYGEVGWPSQSYRLWVWEQDE